MVRLKLIRGRSYTGEVKATREKPFVEVEEAMVEGLVASGYFQIVDSANEGAKEPPKTSKVDDVSPDDTKAVEEAQNDEKEEDKTETKKEAPAGGKAATKTGTKKTARK